MVCVAESLLQEMSLTVTGQFLRDGLRCVAIFMQRLWHLCLCMETTMNPSYSLHLSYFHMRVWTASYMHVIASTVTRNT